VILSTTKYPPPVDMGQQHTSWNALQNGEDLDLDGFFDRIYQRSRSKRTVLDTTSPDEDLFGLWPGAEEFPLRRI
jgi:hypothetical protein